MKTNKKVSPLAVGITGGIGSGKTEAARIFASLGVRVLSADQIAADLIDARPEIRSRIKRTFGERVILRDGTLDRKAMARLVFGDDGLKEQLDAIVHPAVLRAIEDEIARFRRRGEGAIIMIEAALLYEACAEGLFDYVVVVDAPEEKRIARVIIRDHVSRAQALQRMRAQLPAESKAARADFVIRNAGNPALLEKSCRFVHRVLVDLARGNHVHGK